MLYCSDTWTILRYTLYVQHLILHYFPLLKHLGTRVVFHYACFQYVEHARRPP